MNIQPKQTFLDMLKAELEELGESVHFASEDLASKMVDSADRLAAAAAVGDPGFERMIIMERNTLAMKAGLSVGAAAAAVDQRLLGLIGGALRVAAIALA